MKNDNVQFLMWETGGGLTILERSDVGARPTVLKVRGSVFKLYEFAPPQGSSPKTNLLVYVEQPKEE